MVFSRKFIKRPWIKRMITFDSMYIQCNSATGFKFNVLTRCALKTCFQSYSSLLGKCCACVLLSFLEEANQYFLRWMSSTMNDSNERQWKQQQKNWFNPINLVRIAFVSDIIPSAEFKCDRRRWLWDIDVTLTQPIWFIWFVRDAERMKKKKTEEEKKEEEGEAERMEAV